MKTPQGVVAKRRITFDESCCCRICKDSCTTQCPVRREYEDKRKVFLRKLRRVDGEEEKRNLVREYIRSRQNDEGWSNWYRQDG